MPDYNQAQGQLMRSEPQQSDEQQQQQQAAQRQQQMQQMQQQQTAQKQQYSNSNGGQQGGGWEAAPNGQMQLARMDSSGQLPQQQQAAPNFAQSSQPTAPPAATGSPVSANGSITPQSGIATYAPTTFHPITTPEYTAKDTNVATPQAYQAGAIPQSALYKPDQFTQFNGPDQSGVNNQQTALMNAIMANPETMNANVVSQMKEAQKQQALLMQQQGQQGLDARFGAMGRLGSGMATAAGGDLNAGTMANVLNGNRATDIQAAQTNRQDQLNALQASSGLAQDQMGRATQGYASTLAGQQAQSGANQFGASNALQAAIAGEQMKQAQFDSQFRNSSLNLQQQQGNQAAALGAANFNLNRAGQDFGFQQGQAGENFLGYQSQLEAQKLQQQMNQFGASQGQAAGFHNDQMAFNYSQLDQQNQLAMLQLLMGASNGGN